MKKSIVFPSPYGAWVVSGIHKTRRVGQRVSVPLRGMGCIREFLADSYSLEFPSPYGAWVSSIICPC